MLSVITHNGNVVCPRMEVSRGDLCVFFQDCCGVPANVYSISYALCFVFPGFPEVHIGNVQRTPINPAVGEYYAHLMVPRQPMAGVYRIKWSYKEVAESSLQETVTEFEVPSKWSVLWN